MIWSKITYHCFFFNAEALDDRQRYINFSLRLFALWGVEIIVLLLLAVRDPLQPNGWLLFRLRGGLQAASKWGLSSPLAASKLFWKARTLLVLNYNVFISNFLHVFVLTIWNFSNWYKLLICTKYFFLLFKEQTFTYPKSKMKDDNSRQFDQVMSRSGNVKNANVWMNQNYNASQEVSNITNSRRPHYIWAFLILGKCKTYCNHICMHLDLTYYYSLHRLVKQILDGGPQKSNLYLFFFSKLIQDYSRCFSHKVSWHFGK